MTICAKPEADMTKLGSDSGLTYYGHGANVYTHDGVYWRTWGTRAAYDRSAVARRIAGAAERREREEAKVREACRPEKTRMVGGRKW